MLIEKTYCINFHTREDRWEECLEEFKKVNWKVERVKVDTKFNQSQFDLIKKASKHKSSLILEDDVTIRDVSHLEDALNALPKDWDLVSFGATVNERHKEKVSDHLFRYRNGWATHAVLYSQKMMKWIADNFNPDCGVIYDEWLRLNVLNQFNCFIIKPMICYQRPSFSDYRNRYVDYTGGFEQSENLLG